MSSPQMYESGQGVAANGRGSPAGDSDAASPTSNDNNSNNNQSNNNSKQLTAMAPVESVTSGPIKSKTFAQLSTVAPTAAAPATAAQSVAAVATSQSTAGENGVTSHGASNPSATAAAAGASAAELAELTSTEISLDLQGLIDDTHFGDDNLFGDLVEAKKNELNHGYGLHNRSNGTSSPSGSLGSSGHSSPPSAAGQDSPPAFQQYRNALAYLPGSVHHGAPYVPQGQPHPMVKQEPGEVSSNSGGNRHDRNNNSSGAGYTANGFNNSSNNNNGGSSPSSSAVSSTTPNVMAAAAMAAAVGHHHQHHPVAHHHAAAAAAAHQGHAAAAAAAAYGAGAMNTVLPSLKTFAAASKSSHYPLHPGSGSHASPSSSVSLKKKNMDRNTDEYKRRRERNNVAVRKSREKAKLRTRETEERVKILARENERMQKKVELLQEELSVLRSLFSNVGVLPEHIHRELSKHMDNFQAQHNAMATCM